MSTAKPRPHQVKPWCNCGLCKPRPGVNPHPVWGYDLNAVPACQCLMCEQPIGQEAYYEFPMLARFGQMMLIHERCRPATERKTSTARKKRSIIPSRP